MKRYIHGVIFFIITLFSPHLFSQAIIFNELYNSGGNDEWVELLVLQDNLDLRGWNLRDFSSSGAAQAPLVFSNNDAWNNLKKGTLIVIGRPENTFLEDTDPSDYEMTVKSSNSLFFSGTVFLFAGTSEAIQIRNATQTHIHGISWGAGNTGSLPEPKIHFSGASTSNSSTFFIGNDISQLSNLVNWTQNGTASRGVGNSASNIAWINSLRARSEGSGTVSISPTTANGDSPINILFSYLRDTLYSINSLKIIVPSEFTWGQNISSIVISNFSATPVVSGDTISFSNIVFSNDSVSIQINDATTPVYTGSYKFKFLSGEGNSLGEVSPTPIITVYGAALPIAEVKVNNSNGVALKMGDLVTVRGIITVSNQFGGPSYIQDNSGGMSIFGTALTSAVQVGDEVLVSGRVTQFNGLNQLESPQIHSIISSGNIVEPLLATPTQLSGDGINGVEIYEGLLVRINAVLVTELNGSPVSNWAYKNYKLTGTSPSDTVDVRIDNDTEIIGQVAPAGRFDIVGVLSQFKANSPFIGGYQLMPRFSTDIISAGPIIEKFPEEVDLTPNSITLEWHTINPGTSRIRYGKTSSYELGIISPDNTLRTAHSVTVSGLSTATIYNLQAFSVQNSDTSFSSNIVSSTTSDAPTTGVINVYFNKSANYSVSSGVNAFSNVAFKDKLISRINNAKWSVDLALYSLSGTVGADIASALVSAKNRGVKIRVIGEFDTRTTAPWSTIQNAGIPYINDQFGNNDGAGLHHNKFFIFDYRGGAPDSIWLMMGSWNPTDPGTNDDRQNLVEIQDVALAGAYTTEFEEMWGSNSDIANQQTSRFGARKMNNTPHNFIIGGIKVESYFSPSDRTTNFIGRAMSRGNKSINGAVMTITRRDLADSVIALKNRNGKTRLILSNNTDSGTQFSYLQTNGVDIRLKGFTSGLLHHKYAIIDAEYSNATPYVITGSHNWSSSAENSNDENTLIFQDAQIANFYLQEFTARYYEAGGTDSIVLSTNEVNLEIPEQYSLKQNYPNPFNPVTTINYQIPIGGIVTLKVFDILGREVRTLINEEKSAGNYSIEFNASELASGVYIYRLSSGNYKATKKLLLMK
jgi:phosphatidylserine/phosphatidylglycerophosphate/cardiolipin synthase-like enzyme